MTLGIVIHSYLATYYANITKHGPDKAHNAGLKTVQDYRDDLARMRNQAYADGNERLAVDLSELEVRATDIAKTYYLARGRTDAAEMAEVLLVEEPLVMRLKPDSDVKDESIVDLLWRDHHGLIVLDEHKTTNRVPPAGRRLRDLQTLLYAFKLRAAGYEVGAVRWNYLRTTTPEIPTLNKNGTMSRQKVKTTWRRYRAELVAHGLDPADYVDMEAHYADDEITKWFPRFMLPIMSDETLLIEDYLRSAREMERAHDLFEEKAFRPVRSVGLRCDFCGYNRLCDAVLTGGNEADLMTKLFKVKPRREDGNIRRDYEAEDKLLEALVHS